MKIFKRIILIFIFSFQSINAFAAPVFVNDYQPESEMNHVTGVVFNPSGTKMYVLGFHSSDKSYVSEVPLSVPFSTQSAGTPVLQEITTATKRAQDLKFRFGAVGETRTLIDFVHTALNRACLPISARPRYVS